MPWAWRMFKIALICKLGSGTGIGTYQLLNLKTNLNLDWCCDNGVCHCDFDDSKWICWVFFKGWQMISEMTKSIKRQPLYHLVGCVCWVWSCLYISYITLSTGIKQFSKRYEMLVLGAWVVCHFLWNCCDFTTIWHQNPVRRPVGIMVGHMTETSVHGP